MLFAIAYRMLGSVTDAEDLVQEAYLRWEDATETDVRSPRAYLTTIVTRLAINQLRAARTKRETYVGPWLPEPLVTEDAPDTVELAESLSMAFLVLLERLAPVERAAFLLHEVFDFEYAEIARVLDKTEANCRQLVARARKRVGSPEARFEADPAQARRLVEKFTEASFAGDMDGLVALLAEDITIWGDGGGKVPGRRPQAGARRGIRRPLLPRRHRAPRPEGDRRPAHGDQRTAGLRRLRERPAAIRAHLRHPRRTDSDHLRHRQSGQAPVPPHPILVPPAVTDRSPALS